MSTDERVDVAIVGGGPVGAAVALGLAAQGFSVRLLERSAPPLLGTGVTPDDDYDRRVYALAPGCIRFLQQLGAWDAIAQQRHGDYTQMRVWERDPQTALCFDAADLGAAQLGSIVENALLTRALWEQLPPALICSGSGVASLTSTDDAQQLELDDGRRLRARLLVVAEGRASTLREQLGIETLAGAYAQTAVVAHVRTEKPHRATAWQRFLPTGPLALLPLADGRVSIVWSTTEAEALLALDDEDFRVALAEASQHVLGAILGSTARLSFPLTLQHAETYVAPRAVLVGDAAHVVHPLAGQGVNLGLADAEALIRVLGNARREQRDFSGERVLRRYQRARRADVLDMIAVTDGLYRAYRLPIPGLDRARELGIAAVNAVGPLRRELVRRAMGL